MNKNGWAVILTGGAAPEFSVVKPFFEKPDRIIAADSGFDLAIGYGVVPDLVVGDMDSLEHTEALSRYDEGRLIQFSHDKDETDTEIALRILREEGHTRIAVVGGGGGRLDHLFAILLLFEREGRPLLWITESSFVLAVEESVHVRSRIGARVSFFPVGPTPCRIESDGLKWELDGLEWKHGDSGVSNVITKRDMKVTVKSGRLIMVGDFDLLTGVLL